MEPVRVSADVDAVCAAMHEYGYAVVDGFVGDEEAAAMREGLTRVLATTPEGRNDFEGYRTRRVYAVFAKTRCFDRWAVDDTVLGVLDRTLGPHYQFSAPVGIEIGPGEAAQNLHYDDAVYPLPRPHPEVVMNSMWALDDFTAANGATRIIPGSHRWAQGRTPTPDDEVVLAEMPAGSVMFYLGSVWHGGGPNHTDRPRLGVILEYVATWLRPQENHVLAVSPDVAAALPERLQEMLGYNVHPPFLGYVDGRHPQRVLARESRRI